MTIQEEQQIFMYTEMMKIIQEEKIRSVFQPIVCMVSGEIIGYEALSRTIESTYFQSVEQLFGFARKSNLVWELEYLCRRKALQRFSELKIPGYLFLNVDPQVIYSDKFQQGFTWEFLKYYHINPNKIIFEITENTAIEDEKGFQQIINNYKEQGYKIAIDDTGVGYSGLKLLTMLHPQYIKISMDLVRDVDQDLVKQALMKALVTFSNSTGSQLIAEGIETVEELNCLQSLGVHCGQGYLIGKPSEEIQYRFKKVINNKRMFSLVT